LISIFKKRDNKVSDFEIEIDSKLAELINKIDCLQSSDARLRQDIRQIERSSRAFWIHVIEEHGGKLHEREKISL
jgi:hypothetical protein